MYFLSIFDKEKEGLENSYRMAVEVFNMLDVKLVCIGCNGY